MSKKVYMIGNAHLDPIWVWRWQEGTAETKATIRSALDRMNESDDFIFVCSSSFVYECIEDFDQPMFEEMKKRIKEERFIIVGGWYIQADCNSPSGEGFARQALYGQRYFYEKFGVMAKVGYNVDSFGHNAMLPQILKKSGLKNYIYMRPSEHEMHLDSNIFKWIAPDGSAVNAYRITQEYTYNYKDLDDFKERLKKVCDDGLDCSDYAMCFYGVGNHGGGPTKHNIELIHEYMKQNNPDEVVFGNPNKFFEEVEAAGTVLPEYRGDLQHHASGCYSVVAKTKNQVRRCENDLLASEVYCTAANVLLSKAYPTKKFEEAWKDVLFLHFHDSLGGCCVKPAHNDLDNFASEAIAISQRVTNSALQSISWAIDTSDASKGFPIVIFNPHSWEYNGLVTINKQVKAVYNNKGEKQVIQQVFSPANNVYLRDDTMFMAKVPAFGYATYYIVDEDETTFESPVSAGDYLPENERFRSVHFIENELLRVEFDRNSGYIASIFDKETQKNWLSGMGAVPVVIDEDLHDTWSHARNFFDKKVGAFYDAKFTITEKGPLRTTVKVENKYNDCTLTQYFSLTAGKKSVEVKAKVDWHAKERMLKLEFPFNVENPKAFYEIPYGFIERPADGEEEPGQMWVSVNDGKEGFAVLNDNKYSSCIKENVLGLTVLRSKMYCDHGGERPEEADYTDLGEHTFSYAIMPMENDKMVDVVKASREFNEKTVNILENNHNGTLADTYEGVTVKGDSVVISALKRSEDGAGIVLRAFETTGKTVNAEISGGLLRKPLKAEFTPHSIKTFILPDNSDEWREVLLTEFDM